MQTAIEKIFLNHPVWRGSDYAFTGKTLATGLPQLDKILPGGGWPVGALTEILVPQAGVGELQCLMPALAKLSQTGYIAWVNPPYIPYAPALVSQGLKLSHQLLITAPLTQLLWATEQSLRSGACAAVMSWFPEMDFNRSRRLQLAVEVGQNCGFIFPFSNATGSSASALRLSVHKYKEGVSLCVLKGRNASGLSAII